MTHIIDQINLNLLISGEKPGDSYKLFSVKDFSDCDDIDFWNDISRTFGVDECILVQFKGNTANSILSPLVWRSGNDLVYRIGNTSFPIEVNDDGLFVNGIKLDYDTSFSVNKEFLSFSYLVKNSLRKDLGTNKKGVKIKQYDVKMQILFRDDVDPTETSKKAKELFKTGEFSEVVSTLWPFVREIPVFKNSATLPQMFLHIFENNLFSFLQKKLGGSIGVLISNPNSYTDKFGIVLEFDFDGESFSNRIEIDYPVKSWGEFKELSTINSITFSEKTIKFYPYLSDIVFKNSKSQWAIMIITGPNKSRNDWPPSISFIPDYLLKGNRLALKTVKSLFPKDFVFPGFEVVVSPLPPKKEPKFIKAAENFSFDDDDDEDSNDDNEEYESYDNFVNTDDGHIGDDELEQESGLTY